MVTLTPAERDAIRTGDVALLLAKLQEADTTLIQKLKKDKTDETRFFQGASYIVDTLIKILA